MTQSAASVSLVLGGVTVVDTRDGSLSANRDVHIENGKITAIKPTAKDAEGRLDLSGKFVVPGFVDMHSHALVSKSPEGTLALMLANGITGFRQMNGSAKQLAQRAAGQLNLPADSPALVALTGDLLMPGNAGSPEAAVEAVRAGAGAGSDFIKIVAVSPAAFAAAQVEARRLGIRIGGHLPAAVDPRVVSDEGLWSIEHMGPGVVLLVACSTDEDAIRARLAGVPEIKIPSIKLPFMDQIVGTIIRRLVVNPVRKQSPFDAEQIQHAIDTFDEAKARELAATLAADDTWHVPTLVRQLTTEIADLPQFRTDPNLRYMAKPAVRFWNKATDEFEKLPPEMRETFHREYALQLRLVKIFDEAGVKLAAGTDATGAAWVIPGVSLHQEFDELAKAGLSPLRILQMATLNAAQMLEQTATMGTVGAGKLADLVVLDADPNVSVESLHGVVGVVRAGRYYSSSQLESLKKSVASARSVDQ
ncbi:MAG TPA: amidohydrolase family protein [Galbitalea sp.]